MRRSRGEPWWWLWCGECSRCGQWWLVGQEERQNDVYCLRRLDADEVNELLQNNVWPSDFDRYESLLRLGRDAGVMFRFADRRRRHRSDGRLLTWPRRGPELE